MLSFKRQVIKIGNASYEAGNLYLYYSHTIDQLLGGFYEKGAFDVALILRKLIFSLSNNNYINFTDFEKSFFQSLLEISPKDGKISHLHALFGISSKYQYTQQEVINIVEDIYLILSVSSSAVTAIISGKPVSRKAGIKARFEMSSLIVLFESNKQLVKADTFRTMFRICFYNVELEWWGYWRKRWVDLYRNLTYTIQRSLRTR